MPTDPRVEAIRNDPLVGRKTCSYISECYSNSEITDELNEENIDTPEAAVAWARMGEQMWLEKGLNCRWGEDDDPQLLAYNEFMAALRDQEEAERGKS